METNIHCIRGVDRKAIIVSAVVITSHRASDPNRTTHKAAREVAARSVGHAKQPDTPINGKVAQVSM
jgi:hypothetical protein